MNFSVVIPLYNKSAHISRAINSVLNQANQCFEIIVVDDGSTDDSADIVRSIKDSRIRLVSQNNAGVSAARNSGVKEAIAEYVAFLDADDSWAPEFLDTISGLINNFPQAGLYSTAYAVCDPSGKWRNPRFRAIPESSHGVLIPNYFKSATLGDSPVWASAVCIPKTVFRSTGLFPVGEKLGEDHDLWVRIALNYPIAFSWTVCANYFMDSDNRACVKYTPQEDILYVRRLQEMLDDNQIPEALVEDVKKFIAKQLIGIAALNILAGNKAVAKLVLANTVTRALWKEQLTWKFLSYLPYYFVMLVWRLKHYLKKFINA